MGLFRRKKKNEIVERDIQHEIAEVKSPEQIQKERAQTEIEFINQEIQNKTDNLNSISQKHFAVKEEYDSIVSKLMSTKKELQEKNIEFETMTSQLDELSEKLKNTMTHFESVETENQEKKIVIEELRKSKLELDSIKSQIEKHKSELESLKSKTPSGIQSKLDHTKLMQTQAIKQLEELNSKIKAVRQEMEILQAKNQAKKNEIEVAQNELKFIENELLTVGEKNSKSVVEAASKIVSSLNTKIQTAQKEIDILKNVLQRERKEHNESMRQLKNLQNSIKHQGIKSKNIQKEK